MDQYSTSVGTPMPFLPEGCYNCTQHANKDVVPFVFIGHHPIQVGVLLSTWFHATVSDFARCDTVFDFLNYVYRILAFDNQIHVIHWNACLLSPCVHGNGDSIPIFKLLDHNLKMKDILPYLRGNLQIHAISVQDLRMHYLPTILTAQDLSYLSAPSVKTIINPNDEFDRTGPSNEQYYMRQQGGHGLFQNSAELYNSRLDHTTKRMFLSTSSNAGPYVFPANYTQTDVK